MKELIDPNIRCRMDREGAQVHEVNHKGIDYRVLTHNGREAAQDIAEAYTPPAEPSPEILL